MPKPFIILAISRTGTKMLVSALNFHPDIPKVTHEFTGTESQYWEHPYVLSNMLEPWMLDKKITRIALTREDAVAGARSLLMMSYHFPEGVTVLPEHEVIKLAKWRQGQENKFKSAADLSVTYEQLCEGKEITQLPEWFSDKLCDLVEVNKYTMTTDVPKIPQQRLRNEAEIQCLVV